MLNIFSWWCFRSTEGVELANFCKSEWIYCNSSPTESTRSVNALKCQLTDLSPLRCHPEKRLNPKDILSRGSTSSRARRPSRAPKQTQKHSFLAGSCSGSLIPAGGGGGKGEVGSGFHKVVGEEEMAPLGGWEKLLILQNSGSHSCKFVITVSIPRPTWAEMWTSSPPTDHTALTRQSTPHFHTRHPTAPLFTMTLETVPLILG